jgi:adenylate kinase
MKNQLNIVLFGPQGSGKGTQAELLSEKYHLPVLSPGEIFRQEIKKQTNLGKLVESHLKQGYLVPDEIVNDVVIKKIQSKEYKNGFILDGYPRNMAQLETLEKFARISYAFEIMVSDKEVIKRLSGRRICQNCGAVYHLQSKPPKVPGICDKCGGKLYQRDDDQPEAIKKRLEIYHQETEPLLDYYYRNKKLIRINGEQPIEKVFKDIVEALESKNFYGTNNH